MKKKTKPIKLADDSASEWSPSDADDTNARDSPSDADEDSDHSKDSDDSDEDEDDEQRSPCESWEAAAKIKKSNWGKKRVWQKRMGKLLSGVARVNWTMKRYLYALCYKLNVRVKAGATAVMMGKQLDNHLTGDKETVTKVSDKKTRWAARLDSARLLMIMFGTSEMRQQFVLAT